jgi:anti-sigma-K factor RskA
VNTNEYIASGVLELYALGTLSSEEMKEVEANLLLYPELQEELDQILLGLEAFATAHAKEPSPALKDKIFSKLSFDENIQKQEASEIEVQIPAPEVKIIPLQPNYLAAVRWLAAACIALLFTSGFLLFQNSNYKSTINDLASQLETKDKEYADLKVKLTSSEYLLAEVQKPETHKILLNSKSGKKDELAVIFMNVKTEDVMVYTNQLASLPANEQYQLWAMVDGKPMDMGVFDANNSLQSTKKFPELMQAQAFAITVEQKGGSASPTMDKMVVFGAI